MGRNELIEQIVTTWEELRFRGESTSVEELCREHPELVDSVREALTRHGEQDGELAETADVAHARAADFEATRDVLGTTRELSKLTRLGPFQIVKLMAEGGMGAVYEAVDHQLGRSVALKVMRPEFAGHEKARARFLREARAAAALDHDHIVLIYQVGEEQGIPYLAMQLLHGQSLNERLQQGPPLSNAEVFRIGREIAEGLAVAHACGLVHRDIKPANVWLEEGSGRVKILDFGLARAANETARLTQDGSILGTPAYMSPEQASSSGELDHRSDLFSLGSVLYRMVTGRLAFPAESLAELLLALVRDDPVAPRQLNSRIPPALDELILGLLAKDPAARPQSAQAVVETIRRLEKATVPGAWDGLDLKVQVKDEEALSPRAPKRFPVALTALVVIAGLAAGSALLLPGILDAAGNRGELILDSPAPSVAVSVTRGGRTVGVLDPARRPTLRLPAGLYVLELADGTGTLVLASPRVDLRRGTQQVVRLVQNIPVATARDRAAALVAALEQATNRAAKAMVIAAAAPLDGMLEKLAERAAGDAQFQAELARHFAAKGNPSLAHAALMKARTLLEEKLAKEPEDAVLAAELAQLLWDQQETENPIPWTVLKPTKMESRGGATLTRLEDGSILAGGENPDKDTYSFIAQTDLPKITAFRLEALAHESLGKGGPGRAAWGNFALSEISMEAEPLSAAVQAATLKIINPRADFGQDRFPVAASLDGNPATAWSVDPRVGMNHAAVFEVESSQQSGFEGGTKLTFTLDFRFNIKHALGRFRLSASGNPATLDREQTRLAAMQLTDPWAQLAAAYAVVGRSDEALQYFGAALKRADGYEARKPILELAARFEEVLSALTQRHPGDPQLQLAWARKLAERGNQRLAEKQPAKAQAELEKSRQIFTRLRATDPVPQWTVLTPVEMKTETGARMELQNDSSIFVHRLQSARDDTYSLVFQPESRGITGLRLEVLADPRLPHGGPGWGDNGNFVLNELTLEAAPAERPGQARSIPLRNATADFSQVLGSRWDVRGAVDGNGTTGWAVHPEVNKDHTAVFELAEEVGDGQAARLTVRLIHQYASPNHRLGRFRLSMTNDRATLQVTRIGLDLKDTELVDCDVALGGASVQQGRTNEAVAAFSRALEQAPDRASRARIIAAAAPREGMLEILAERAAGDAQFQAELARHFTERGNVPSADAARSKALASFEGKLANEPENSALGAELADLLLMDTTPWTVLKPLEMKSNSGVGLTVQEDRSLFVSGKRAVQDAYSVDYRDVPQGFRAIRLEALRDDRLPSGGPGTHPGGEFVLSEFKVFRPDETQASRLKQIPLRSACATFEEGPAQQSLEAGESGWSIWGGTGRSQTAYFAVARDEGIPVSDRLRFLLEFSHETADRLPATLGRFRLSVSDDAGTFDREKRRIAATKVGEPWARLAAAYHVNGNQGAFERLLKHHPAAAAGSADLFAADQDWERAIVGYRKVLTDQPNDAYVLARLAVAYQAADQTREAVPHLVTLSSADPEDTMLSMKVAALQAWFGQDKELAATRQRVLAFAQDTNSVQTANRAAKVCSILPCTETAELEAALSLGRTAVKLGPDGGWNLLALGMAEYRSGNNAAAEKALRAAADAGPTNRYVTGTSQFFRAMSLFRQGKPDEAHQLAIAAAATMKPLPADERNPPPGDDDHNDLILWLAHKEAKAMIQFDAPAAAPATPGGKWSMCAADQKR